MLELSKIIRATICEVGELSKYERLLATKALEVRRNAQAPYSHYHVGAALLSISGNIYVGCNVETASYTQTTHAEQAAIVSMVAAEGPQKLLCIAIVGAPARQDANLLEKPSPGTQIGWEDINPSCGHCLQIIHENCLGDPNVMLLEVFLNGWIARVRIGDAFPLRFGPDKLGIDVTQNRRGESLI